MKADLIISLKRATTTEYYERLKFLLVDCVFSKRFPTEDEDLEIQLILLRIGDEAEILWIEKFIHQMMNIRRTYFALNLREFVAPHLDRFEYAQDLLETAPMPVRIGNAYFGRLNQNVPKVLLRKRHPSKPIKRRVHKRYIGVGYRDQGNMKNIATDGSPRWQDVCSFTETHLSEKQQRYRERLKRELKGNLRQYPKIEIPSG